MAWELSARFGAREAEDPVTNAKAPSKLAGEALKQGKKLGIPLHTLELIASEPKVARDFLRAVRENRARRFVDALDVTALERALAARELRVSRDSPGPVGRLH